MIDTCMKNRIKFTWSLFDSRFSSVENMKYIKLEHKKEFIGALKSNRLVAPTEEDRKNKKVHPHRSDRTVGTGSRRRSAEGAGVSGPSRPAGLYRQGRKRRHPVSRLQSADSGSEHNHDNLSKTTECSGVP